MREIWKDIPGYEGIYKASNMGNVKSLDRVVRKQKLKGVILRSAKTSTGYRKVTLYKNKTVKQFYVHVLICLSFKGIKPPKKEVNHKDGNRENNKIKNLEYVTRRENNLHFMKNAILRGVSKNRQGYSASISINGKPFWLGYFKTKEEANKSYVSACLALGDKKYI